MFIRLFTEFAMVVGVIFFCYVWQSKNVAKMLDIILFFL